MARPPIRRIVPVILTTTALTLTGITAANAQATEEAESTRADLTCVIAAEGPLTPPLQPIGSPIKTRSSFNAKDELAVCEGTIGGQKIDTTTLATAGLNLRSDEPVNCGSFIDDPGLTGSGTISITATTVDGQKKTHTTRVDFSVIGPVAELSGGLVGVGTFQPTEGDCVVTPLSRALTEFAASTP